MMGIRRSTSDIISNLPSNIMENILKYLPLRDAGRTSVLSRRWRYNWVTLPQLVFQNQFFVSSGDTEKIKAIICRVLLLHQGPLVKFELSYPPFGSCMDIDNWILILLKKNIQKFTLRLFVGPNHECPCHLFSFLQLKHLNLRKCVFKPPPAFKGFSRLVDLNLLYVNVAPEMFGEFISHCPLLERLRLEHCSEFDSLEIYAPNLKDFTFCGVSKSISFKNTPLLAVISITLLSYYANVEWHEEETDSEWVKFFQCLPAAIEYMHLDSSFLESFPAGHLPVRLPSTLNHLKVLALSDICCYILDHVSRALCLLRSFPNLERVKISMYDDDDDDVPQRDLVVEYLEAQDSSEFSLKQLREVKIRNFSGAKSEMHFTKLLLAHSTVLEKMEILYYPDISDEVGVMMLDKLKQSPKASPKAEVVCIPLDIYL